MARVLTLREKIERSIITTYRKVIWGNFIGALKDYRMVLDGDKIAVCMSGGKDSFLLAKCMQELQRHSTTAFSLIFVLLNPGYSPSYLAEIKDKAEILGISLNVFSCDIFVEIKNEPNPCYLCSKKRRKALYAYAKERGCNKIALGHHFDDIIETLLMSIAYGGQIQGMRPRLKSTLYPEMELIRPLAYIKEKDIKNWERASGVSFKAYPCPYDDALQKRKKIKEIIATLRNDYKKADVNIFKSMEHVQLDTLLGYKKEGKHYFYIDELNKEKE